MITVQVNFYKILGNILLNEINIFFQILYLVEPAHQRFSPWAHFLPSI